MKKLFAIMLCAAVWVNHAIANETNQSIPDFRINCGGLLPDDDSIIREGNSLTVKLDNKDVGKCSTDRKPYKTKSYFKPWSERAEVIFSHNFSADELHRIKFKMKIIKGYSHGNRNETWFQIKCDSTSAVPVMAFLRKEQPRQFAFSLAPGTENSKFIKKRSPTTVKYGKWMDVEIEFGNYKKSDLSVFIDGKSMLSMESFIRPVTCPNNFELHLGIYRGGMVDKALSTSEIIYKDIKFSKLYGWNSNADAEVEFSKLNRCNRIYVQQFLKGQGLYRSSIDGKWGPVTAAAVEKILEQKDTTSSELLEQLKQNSLCNE
jgi:hypothetical protein